VVQSPRRLDDQPPGCPRTADLLGALSLAADLATGLPAGHAVRSCYLGMHIADRLQLLAEHRAALYYAELLMDAGCTAWTSHLAARRAGLMHDVGLVTVPSFALNKPHEKLTPVEWESIRLT